MFKVNGMRIDVEGMQLLQDLKLSLEQNGIQLLSTIKPGIQDIQFSCPSHKGGQEHSPSCGITTTDKYSNGKLYEAGTVHCFTCGYTATLAEFISFCFGYQDGGIFGNKWLKANYRGELIQRNRHFELPFENATAKQVLPTIPDKALDRYRYYHDYMFQRGLTEQVIELFDIGYDSMSQELTFPICDLSGNVKWLLRRSVKRKFYNIPSGLVKTDYLFGVKQCIELGVTEIYIVESVINCLTLWTLGIPAIAILGTGGGQQYDMLASLPFRHYVLALDNDKAGQEGTQRLINKLQYKKLLSRLQYREQPHDKAKDINDLRDEIKDYKKIPINF